jgi:endonuclease YncB( thermonuclease family)
VHEIYIPRRRSFPRSPGIRAPSDRHIGRRHSDSPVDRKLLKIRLANIDALEKKQAFGDRSKRSLPALCFGKDAYYDAQNIDRYGRTIAVVTVIAAG